MANPARTCVACRRGGRKGELVKLANTPAGVVVDYTERLPGRGAYVCAEPACIKKALDPKVLSRAFKGKALPPAEGEFISQLEMNVARKINSLLGMAKKSGKVAAGFDAAVEASRKMPGGIAFVALDASGNTVDKAAENMKNGPARVVRYSTKQGLGALLGTAPVAVLYIGDASLAAALLKETGRLEIFSTRG